MFLKYLHIPVVLCDESVKHRSTLSWNKRYTFLLKTKIHFFVNAAFNIYEEKYLEESFCGTFLLKSVQWFCRESLPEKQISNL